MELYLHRGLRFPGVFTKEIFLHFLGKRFYGKPIQWDIREFTYTLLKDSKNKEHLPYPAMFWACSKCSKRSDTGMHHMCIGVPCFLLSFVKCIFYLLPCTGPVLSVQMSECITCVLGCLAFYYL